MRINGGYFKFYFFLTLFLAISFGMFFLLGWDWFYGWLLFLVGLAVLVFILRTLTVSSLQGKTQTEDSLLATPDGAVDRLCAALRFQTVSYEVEEQIDRAAFKKFLEFLTRAFPLVHNTLKQELINEYALLFEWRGRNSALNPVLLAAHYDVVPAGLESEWQEPPFAGNTSAGYIWGRGAMDDKSCLLAILEAVEELLKSGFTPERTIFLAFGHDEEIGGQNGAVKLAGYLQTRGIRFDYVVDEGLMITEGVMENVQAPIAFIGIAEKGYLDVELVATSNAGHASMPGKDNAVMILARALCRFEKRPFTARSNPAVRQMLKFLAPEAPLLLRSIFANLWLTWPLVKQVLIAKHTTNAMLRTTIAPTMLAGSAKVNVLPGEAKAALNIRIIPGENKDTVMRYLAKVLAGVPVAVREANQIGFNPASISSVDSNGFQVIRQAIRKIFPEAIVVPSMAMAGSDSRHYAGLCEDIYRFVPVWVNKDALSRIHGVNERISIENYRKMIKFYMYFITNA